MKTDSNTQEYKLTLGIYGFIILTVNLIWFNIVLCIL